MTGNTEPDTAMWALPRLPLQLARAMQPVAVGTEENDRVILGWRRFFFRGYVCIERFTGRGLSWDLQGHAAVGTSSSPAREFIGAGESVAVGAVETDDHTLGPQPNRAGVQQALSVACRGETRR